MDLLLKDKVFISTRPEGQSGEFIRLFSNVGATVHEMPMIKIQATQLSESDKACFKKLKEYHWIIFTSPNGVKYFFNHLKKVKSYGHVPKSTKFAVIGEKTETVLNSFGLKASFKNPASTGEDFAAAFVAKLKSKKDKPNILLSLGNIARNVIQNKVSEYANCTRINVYHTIAAEDTDTRILQHIKKDRYDMLIFTSPSGIENFLAITKKQKIKNIRIACIGETTSNTAIKNNIIPEVVADKSTAEGLFESILTYYKSKNQ